MLAMSGGALAFVCGLYLSMVATVNNSDTIIICSLASSLLFGYLVFDLNKHQLIKRCAVYGLYCGFTGAAIAPVLTFLLHFTQIPDVASFLVLIGLSIAS